MYIPIYIWRGLSISFVKVCFHFTFSFQLNIVMVFMILKSFHVLDVGSNNSGYYELQAVLTHKGRSSSSGHYVAWIRYKDDTWVKCDDNVVTPVQSEDVLKLSGGGNY